MNCMHVCRQCVSCHVMSRGEEEVVVARVGTEGEHETAAAATQQSTRATPEHVTFVDDRAEELGKRLREQLALGFPQVIARHGLKRYTGGQMRGFLGNIHGLVAPTSVSQKRSFERPSPGLL